MTISQLQVHCLHSMLCCWGWDFQHHSPAFPTGSTLGSSPKMCWMETWTAKGPVLPVGQSPCRSKEHHPLEPMLLYPAYTFLHQEQLFHSVAQAKISVHHFQRLQPSWDLSEIWVLAFPCSLCRVDFRPSGRYGPTSLIVSYILALLMLSSKVLSFKNYNLSPLLLQL